MNRPNLVNEFLLDMVIKRESTSQDDAIFDYIMQLEFDVKENQRQIEILSNILKSVDTNLNRVFVDIDEILISTHNYKAQLKKPTV